MKELNAFSAESSFIFSILFLISSCSTQNHTALSEAEALKKISFDIEMLNENGLYGEPDGLISLDYKFCIPKNDDYKNEVSMIDTTINFHKGTGMKDGCSKDEYLCIGNTHQKDFKQVLIKLASLEYVEKLDQMFWE